MMVLSVSVKRLGGNRIILCHKILRARLPCAREASRLRCFHGLVARKVTASPSGALGLRNAPSWNYMRGTAAVCLVGRFWEMPLTRYPTSCEESWTNQEGSAVIYHPESALRSPEELSGWKRLRRKVVKTLRLFARVVKLMIALTPVAALYPIQLVFRRRDPKLDAHEILLSSAELEEESGPLGWYLRLCLRSVEWSGAAVIKLMQWASSRPDLFGHEFCSVFSRLQDSTTPHSWKHTEKVLRRAYGDDWKERIRLEKLIGSGCIGQVYKGVAKDELGKEQDVAVKVMHPNVLDDIDDDLDLLRLAVRFLNSLPFEVCANLRWLNLEGAVEEFAGMLKLQLDFRTEATNLQRFNENFANDPSIVFPKLIEGFEAHPGVLVETFCEGVPILDFIRENPSEQELRSNLCLAGIRGVCQMIFVDNFMHGDLHPGNVFVSPDHKFVLLDVGIVTEYTESDHELIVNILGNFIRSDGAAAGRLAIDDSNSRLLASHDKAVDEELFIEKIKALTTKAKGKDFFMEHLGTYITYICDAAAEHHVMMNQAFVSAALAIKIQEGIALALDPSIEIWRVANPIILKSEARRRGAKFGQQLMDSVAGKNMDVVKSRTQST